MKHVKQPNRWSCSIASVAMVTEIPIEDIIKAIGHDGSEIVFPELPIPMCYRGFDFQEIVDFAIKNCWSVTPIEAMPTCTPNGIDIRDVFSEDKIKERMDWYFDRFDGVACGPRNGLVRWHCIAWSHEEQQWHDPSGPILPKNKPSINIGVFWIFIKNENFIRNQLLTELINK